MHPAAFVRAAGPNPAEWLRRLRLEISGRRDLREAFEAALSGCTTDAAPAVRLASMAGLAGCVCVGLYLAGAAPDVVRAAVGERWQGRYRHLVSAADAAGGLMLPMLRYAAFPTRVLRETVTVWSYSLSSPESALQAGRPWSTYRAHMAALAVKLGMRRGKPCFVGRRTIHRSEVVLYLPAENGDSWDYDRAVEFSMPRC